MTRSTLRRKQLLTTFWLGLVLVVALTAKLVEIGSIGDGDKRLVEYGKAIYEFLKDMAVVFVTIAAAWLAAVLQRRSNFIESLEEEWRNIVTAKSKLFAYCEKENTTYGDYIEAFRCISDTIDGMRIVYRNVGETDAEIGLHPYVPLQDMRRAFQTLDPSKEREISAGDRKLVREAVLRSFYALRETFLEELDLEEPKRPILVWGAMRTKKRGKTRAAERQQDRQARQRDAMRKSANELNGRIDRLLEDEWEREHRKGGS